MIKKSCVWHAKNTYFNILSLNVTKLTKLSSNCQFLFKITKTHSKCHKIRIYIGASPVPSPHIQLIKSSRNEGSKYELGPPMLCGAEY